VSIICNTQQAARMISFLVFVHEFSANIAQIVKGWIYQTKCWLFDWNAKGDSLGCMKKSFAGLRDFSAPILCSSDLAWLSDIAA
jgi:hypothetical protein